MGEAISDMGRLLSPNALRRILWSRYELQEIATRDHMFKL